MFGTRGTENAGSSGTYGKKRLRRDSNANILCSNVALPSEMVSRTGRGLTRFSGENRKNGSEEERGNASTRGETDSGVDRKSDTIRRIRRFHPLGLFCSRRKKRAALIDRCRVSRIASETGYAELNALEKVRVKFERTG